MQPAREKPPEPYEPWRLPEPKRQGRRFPRRALLVGVAGVAAAALVAAGAVVFWPGGDGPAPAVSGARPAAEIFAVDPAAKSDGRDQRFTAAASAGGTLVVAGGDFEDTTGRAQFLVSRDAGRSFQAAQVQDGGVSGVPRRVAGSASGWVALGEDSDGGTVAWTSRDGRTWTPRTPADGVFEDGDRVLGLAAHGSGYLAVGTTAPPGDLSDGSPLVWLSSDGRTWERLDSGRLGMTKGEETLSLLDAAAHGSTLVVKGRWAKDDKAAPRNRVWLSTDGGRSWQESKPPSPAGTRGLQIASGPSGLLAVRDVVKGKDTSAAVFTSTDGGTWQEAGRIELPRGMRVITVTAAERTTAVVAGEGDRLQVARSTDGRTWQQTPEFVRPARLLPAVAAVGDNLVLAGGARSGGDIDGVLTVQDASGRPVQVPVPAPAPDQTVRALAATGSQVVAVGSTNGDAAVWDSSDGDTWRRGRTAGAVFAGPGLQRLQAVAGGTSGWLAIGTDARTPRRPIVAISQNGREWSAVAGRAFAPGDKGTLRAYGVAAGRSGYVVVGEDGSSAVVWFTSDLRNWQRGSGEDKDLGPGKDGNRWMQAVAATAAGYVAVGGAKGEDGHMPAVWTSQNGQDWKLRELPEQPEGSSGYLRHVAVSGSTTVALGERRDGGGTTRAFAYVSADGGQTWQDVTLPEIAGAGAVSSVSGTPTGFVVSGSVRQGGAGDAAVWTSADGRSWRAERPQGTALSGPGDQRLTTMVAFGDGLLGVGVTTGRQASEPTLWRR